MVGDSNLFLLLWAGGRGEGGTVVGQRCKDILLILWLGCEKCFLSGRIFALSQPENIISTHSKDFCGKIALIRQISKIKISNHQISTAGSTLQYVANRYTEGFWKFSMFWCILQIWLNLLVHDCKFNYITKPGEKKKNPWLCEGGERPASLLATYDFLTGSTQSWGTLREPAPTLVTW